MYVNRRNAFQSAFSNRHSAISVFTIPVDKCLEGAAKFRRQILVLDRVKQGNGGLVGFQLRNAARTRREMPFEIRVDVRRQVTLDEVGEKPDEIVAAAFLRHSRSSAQVRGLPSVSPKREPRRQTFELP